MKGAASGLAPADASRQAVWHSGCCYENYMGGIAPGPFRGAVRLRPPKQASKN